MSCECLPEATESVSERNQVPPIVLAILFDGSQKPQLLGVVGGHARAPFAASDAGDQDASTAATTYTQRNALSLALLSLHGRTK
jgi:hypothetical protein